jgi:hypothetical protein
MNGGRHGEHSCKPDKDWHFRGSHFEGNFAVSAIMFNLQVAPPHRGDAISVMTVALPLKAMRNYQGEQTGRLTLVD